MSRIVVGVDGSDASKDALRWAVDEAKLRGASVDAVHAWQVPMLPPDVGAALAPAGAALEVTTLLPQVKEGAHRTVAEIVEEVVADDAGVEVRPLAVEGPPATALIEAARGADLLVVGSRGHGGFTGLLVGSVSMQAVQHAPCPVVICRHR
jgi:nucleotide-binding universal stress UspA family protein